jgi:HSP20 family protein
VKRDERDALEEVFGVWKSDRSMKGQLRMQADLAWEPPVDMIETADTLVVVVEIAGMEGKDIDVVTDGKVLKIHGVRRGSSPSGHKQFHAVEIQVGRFARELPIPVDIDPARVAARYRNGFLEVTLQKVKPAAHERKVQID